jgi:hypothetical protein
MDHAVAVAHLVSQIERNQIVAGQVAACEPGLRASLDRLQLWQCERLDATYADLRAQHRYREACEFFLDELYGGRDVHERDRQLARVVPVMRRFLPAHLLHAVGDAIRLQAVSLEFDLALARILEPVEKLDQPAYAAAYRQHGAWAERIEQLALIDDLGQLLDETVQKPMVHRLIRMMHGPARMAGFGALQGFLRRGLDAFAVMHGAEHFLATIAERERAALDAMRAGADWPFETWAGRGPER